MPAIARFGTATKQFYAYNGAFYYNFFQRYFVFTPVFNIIKIEKVLTRTRNYFGEAGRRPAESVLKWFNYLKNGREEALLRHDFRTGFRSATFHQLESRVYGKAFPKAHSDPLAVSM